MVPSAGNCQPTAGQLKLPSDPPAKVTYTFPPRAVAVGRAVVLDLGLCVAIPEGTLVSAHLGPAVFPYFVTFGELSASLSS